MRRETRAESREPFPFAHAHSRPAKWRVTAPERWASEVGTSRASATALGTLARGNVTIGTSDFTRLPQRRAGRRTAFACEHARHVRLVFHAQKSSCPPSLNTLAC